MWEKFTEDDRRGLIAGILGGIAFLVVMAMDLKVTREKTNDLRLLAGIVPGMGRFWATIGAAIHFVNGAALGVVYARLQDRLPGPGWLRGTMFGLIENMVLWPAMMLLDRVHPEMDKGALSTFNRPVPFIQELVRHVAYGAVLGWAFERLRR